VQKSYIEVGVIGMACAHWWTRVHARSEPAVYTQRFVPDSLNVRTARFEHAHRRLAEQSHIDHAIKLCPLFVDL